MPFGLTVLEYVALLTALITLHATLQFSAVLHRDEVAWRVFEEARAGERVSSFSRPTSSVVILDSDRTLDGESSGVECAVRIVSLALLVAVVSWILMKRRRVFRYNSGASHLEE